MIYPLAMFLGLLLSGLTFAKLAERDGRLVWIYVGGLFGALLAAKLAFVLAELPWLLGRPTIVREILHGKTLLGALFGGYAGVEVAKWKLGFRGTTGDVFASLVPAGLVLGRIGCSFAGCCLGVPTDSRFSLVDAHGIARIPIAPVEAAFHASCALAFAVLARRGLLAGQRFHVFLVVYGLFRAATEPFRATPHYAWGASPYQLLALALAAFGAFRFVQRQREGSPALSTLPSG